MKGTEEIALTLRGYAAPPSPKFGRGAGERAKGENYANRTFATV
jgi:hypothetical protein